MGLASAPSQLLCRDGLDDSAHGYALDADRPQMSATSATTLPESVWRSILPSAVMQRSASWIASGRPTSAAHERRARDGVAPSASASADPATRAGARPLGRRKMLAPNALLELGDLLGRRALLRPEAARHRRGRASVFCTSRAATSSTSPGTAPSPREGRAGVGRGGPANADHNPQRPILDRGADQLACAARRGAERVARQVRHPGDPHASATSSTAEPSIRRANLAVQGRPERVMHVGLPPFPAARPEERRGGALAPVGQRHLDDVVSRGAPPASPARARPPPHRRCRCRAACRGR